MKTALLTLAAVAAIAIAPAPMSQASAAEQFSGTRIQEQQPQDISAARKKKKRSYLYRRGPAYAYGWRPADPTAGPNSLYSYFRRHGYCVIDEGYGRATLCN
jgi:hypothetical protein